MGAEVPAADYSAAGGVRPSRHHVGRSAWVRAPLCHSNRTGRKDYFRTCSSDGSGMSNSSSCSVWVGSWSGRATCSRSVSECVGRSLRRSGGVAYASFSVSVAPCAVMASGFGISVLVVERFRHHDREGRALYDTMVAIRDRLEWNLKVVRPATPGDYITSGVDGALARCFREELTNDWMHVRFLTLRAGRSAAESQIASSRLVCPGGSPGSIPGSAVSQAAKSTVDFPVAPPPVMTLTGQSNTAGPANKGVC